MSTQPISNIEIFNTLLHENHQEYLLLGDLPSENVKVVFTGGFNGIQVVWNACVRTIQDYALHHEVTEDPMQFIDISHKDDVYWLEVGLNVSVIDKAMIERTIIMIRNYKRLDFGRHEYGARSKTI